MSDQEFNEAMDRILKGKDTAVYEQHVRALQEALIQSTPEKMWQCIMDSIDLIAKNAYEKGWRDAIEHIGSAKERE